MRVEQMSSSLSQETGATGTTNSTTPKDEFLRMLVAQLQHQDPMSPQDSAAFVAQLAQFAALEQSAETNQRLAALEASQASGLRANFANLVGRTASATIESIQLPRTPGGGETLSAHLDAPAEKVDVVIIDASGREVRNIPLGAQGAGDHAFVWDGTDNSGKTLPEGTYRVEIRASAPGGGTVSASARVQGIVRAMDLEGGSVRFRIGSVRVSPADIMSVETQSPVVGT